MNLTRTLAGTVERHGPGRRVSRAINVEQVLRRLERAPVVRAATCATGRTPFDRLNIVLKIANGAVNVEDASVDGAAVKIALYRRGPSIPGPADPRPQGQRQPAQTGRTTSPSNCLFVVNGNLGRPPFPMAPTRRALIRPLRGGRPAPRRGARQEDPRRGCAPALERLSGARPGRRRSAARGGPAPSRRLPPQGPAARQGHRPRGPHPARATWAGAGRSTIIASLRIRRRGETGNHEAWMLEGFPANVGQGRDRRPLIVGNHPDAFRHHHRCADEGARAVQRTGRGSWSAAASPGRCPNIPARRPDHRAAVVPGPSFFPPAGAAERVKTAVPGSTPPTSSWPGIAARRTASLSLAYVPAIPLRQAPWLLLSGCPGAKPGHDESTSTDSPSTPRRQHRRVPAARAG